ncbi:RHTO0S08e02696g1_1 [Rhodotorula toruloides]|uniref:RHTO0S08e02696g1_1 n=2 Tax=Rhodotorula toruloides TaxID=5286 RepID=A0A061B267_RHOTO|nr:meiotic nuclear divisions 1-like protein [Rhodotorula toruloides NP11]EMS20267.1 meiotic nuclear divisions 1-like protein [Rhodotorula toruloides NP11]KAJ8294601.1 Meiotic nuclear division protein 1 [Rhodotorula toruloides]CDR43523.1 RHTO0S08e02696g1_1 [Rhodotorula toruloides]
MLDLFRETKEFYKLQELEKLAPKTKGITSMSVKEVLQSLVDDSRKQLSTLEQSIKTLKRQHQDLGQDVVKEEADREETAKLQSQHLELEKQLDSFTTPDEVKLAETKQELIERLKTSALRSTGKIISLVLLLAPAGSSPRFADNISAFLSYQTNNGGSEAAAAFRQEHNLPEDFDDLAF